MATLLFQLAIAVVLLYGCGGGSSDFPEMPAAVASSREAAIRGEALYRRNCTICHGVAGHGDGLQAASLRPPPADLRNLRGVRAEPGYWFFRIKEGGKRAPLARSGSAMPGWGDHLSDEDIWDIVVYLTSFVKEGS